MPGIGIGTGLGINLGWRPPSGPTQSAFPSGMYAMFDASNINGSSQPANGASVPLWQDTIKGIQFTQGTGANQPTFVANGLATGKPTIRGSGGQTLGALRSGAASGLNTVFNSKVYTFYIVMKGIQAQSYGMPFGATADGGGLICYANGAFVGRFDGPNDMPWTGSGIISFGMTASTEIPPNGGGNAIVRNYINGACVAPAFAVPPSTTADFGIFAGNATGGFPCIGDIAYIFIYDRELSPPEMLQLERAWRDRAGLAYPWAGSEYLVFAGDSMTANSTADAATFGYPYQLAQRRGLGYGQWSNLGISGISVDDANPADDQMQDRFSKDIAGTKDQLGFAPKYLVFEWYNMNGTAGATAAGYTKTYLQTMKSESPSSKIALMTSITFQNENAATGAGLNRANFNSTIMGSGYLTGLADVIFPIHTDANIGVAGSWSSTYFNGNPIHPDGKSGYPTTQSGYPYIADKFQQALATASF